MEERNSNYIIKGCMSSILLVGMVIFGTTLYLMDYIFWAFFNIIISSCFIYYLCLYYFHEKNIKVYKPRNLYKEVIKNGTQT